MQYAWTCSCCGKQFSTLPMSYGFDAPLLWYVLPEAERDRRARLDTDFCVVDDRHFFVRGCIEIPIVDQEEKFVWGVWVSQSRESFGRALDLFHTPVIENEPPHFGWLSNDIPAYPTTRHLKTHVHYRAGGLRPLIELERTHSPLSVEQHNGITIERVQEIAAALQHRH
jgi:hypothetical protein